jgi:drug/metabolite transporter (DMT)-like permease
MSLKSILQILLLSAAWGISFLMMRIAVPDYPPLWIAMLRCALGAALMWLVLAIGGKSLPPRRLFPWLLLVAFLNNAVPFSLFAWGEQWVPSNTASVLNATTPIWTLLLSMSIDRRMPRWLTSVGVILAFIGVIVVVVTHAPEPGTPANDSGMWWGTLAIGVAALCYAIASLLAKQKLRGLDPIGLATTQLTLAALLLLPVALGGAWPLKFLAPAPLGAIAVLGFIGSGIAYLLYYKLLAEVSATQVVAVTYLLPVWGVFWGLVAGEAIGTATYIGVAITVGGLILLNLRGAGRTTNGARGSPETANPTAPK